MYSKPGFPDQLCEECRGESGISLCLQRILFREEHRHSYQILRERGGSVGLPREEESRMALPGEVCTGS